MSASAAAVRDPPRDPSAAELLEWVACPICGGQSARELRSARYPLGVSRSDLVRLFSSSSAEPLLDRVVACTACGLVHLSPRIRADIVLEGYAGAEDATFFAQNPTRIRTFSRVLRGLAKEIPLGKGARVLDVGCAGGAFVRAASDIGCDVVGVEPSAWLAERGRTTYGIDLRAGTLEAQSFPAASFDVVTLWDVIEHLASPKETLSEIVRVLRPGGFLVVNFPDYGSLVRRAMGWSWPFFLSVHLSYFTKATMRRLLEGSGFRVLASRPFWQTLPLGYVLSRAAHVFAPFELAKSAAEKLSVADLPFTYQLGQTLVVAQLHGRGR